MKSDTTTPTAVDGARHLTTRGRPLTALLCLAALTLGACTTYRMVRHREPDPRNVAMFPVRTVARARSPFEFVRAPALRTDLDTISVRAPNSASRVPFSEYMERSAIDAFLVIRNDTILYETYRGGHVPGRLHVTMSVSKSVLSALVGIAIGEGKIGSLDQAVTEYLPRLRSNPAFDGMTIRHLLEMKSGLRFTTTGDGMWADLRSDEARVYYSTDLPGLIAGARRDTAPGAQWKYKDTDAEILGWVLTEATGQTVAAYASDKLWSRIGTEFDATWSLDHRGGLERVSSGFNATARDLARFGRLYLDRGLWNGERVIPADWLSRSVAVDPMRPEPDVGTWWQMQHTLYWWHAIQPKSGDYFADGSGGQRVYVDPASRTIIVQLAHGNRQDFPFRRIAAHLNGTPWDYPRSIPALLVQAGRQFGADSIAPMFDRLMAERRRFPERYVIYRQGMQSAARILGDSARTRPAADEIARIIAREYP
ncbi:MAG: serine hydrolase [Gemmatimonadaceae bacterium]